MRGTVKTGCCDDRERLDNNNLCVAAAMGGARKRGSYGREVGGGEEVRRRERRAKKRAWVSRMFCQGISAITPPNRTAITTAMCVCPDTIRNGSGGIQKSRFVHMTTVTVDNSEQHRYIRIKVLCISNHLAGRDQKPQQA